MSMYSESLRAFLKPIVGLLDDPDVTEIMINGPTEIWAEKSGKVYRTEVTFTEEGLAAAARNMAQFVGRVLSDERPRLDARLPDGSRIHVVLPPVARRGCTIAIRKFAKDKLTMQRLVEVGAATPGLARLIDAAVKLKLNVVVAGGTGSGKTTLLNVLSRFIPDDERILTIEDSAELQLQQPHIVSFESRPPDKFGKGEVTLGDLLMSALRLRPDRIVVGEVRGGECFYLLQAMNTGHGGSLATTHANTPTDTLRRLESLCLLAGVDLPMVAVRAQVASAIHLVVCCERFSDGSRKITHVSEVLPLNDKGDYRTQDLFVYTQTGKDQKTGKVSGYHAPTGILPTFLDRLKANGFPDLDEKFFDPATYKVPPPPVFHHDAEVKTRWAPSLRHRESGEADPEPIAAPEPAPVALEPAPAPAPAPAPSPSTPFAKPEHTPAPKHETAPRARDPEPTELPKTPLTMDTNANAAAPPPAVEAIASAIAEELGEEAAEIGPSPGDTDPGIRVGDPEDEPEDTARTTPEELAAKEAAKAAGAAKPEEKKAEEKPKPPPVVDEPSIQISEDLLEDMERVVSNEATYVKPNPLLVKQSQQPAKPAVAVRAPSKPPVAPKPAPAAPARKKRDEDETTDPHIRVPTK